jgi:hypothetical protein
MAKIDEIRLDNARRLLAEAGGQKGMIEITGRSQSQISHLMGEKPIKPIGKRIAESLEDAFKKPKGWMDTDRRLTSSSEEDIAFDSLVVRLKAIYSERDNSGRSDLEEALRSLLKLSGRS